LNELLSRERKREEKIKIKIKEVKERKGKGKGRSHITSLRHEIFKRKVNIRDWEEEKKKAKFKVSK